MAAHMKEYVEEMERLIPNCPAAETDFSGKQQMIMKMNWLPMSVLRISPKYLSRSLIVWGKMNRYREKIHAEYDGSLYLVRDGEKEMYDSVEQALTLINEAR